MADEQDPNIKNLLRAYVKIGDKQCAPGKEWASLRHGMVICWQRLQRTVLTGKQVSGPEPGRMDKIAFGILEMDDTLENENRLKYACEVAEVWVKENERDKEKWRARRGYVDTLEIATKIGDAKIDTDWKAEAKSVEPKYVPAFAPATDVKESSASTFEASIIDRNAVSTGSFTVGSGGDYSTWALAYADIANLTGNLTFTQIADVTEVAAATITENLGGFTFACTVGDGNWHYANTARGYLTTISHAGHGIDLQCEGWGVVEISRLRLKRTTASTTADYGMLNVDAVTDGWSGSIHHCVLDCGNVQTMCIRINDGDPCLNIYTNKCYGGLAAAGTTQGIGVPAGSAGSTYENNTCTGLDFGLNLGDQGGTVQRNACYANTADFANTANATGYSNASDDATAADANWTPWSSDNISGRDPAVDFDSTTTDSPMYLRPVHGGGLQNPANTTYLAANTTDLAGRPWATYGDWIGARVGLPAPTLPSGSSYRVSGSTVAVAVQRVFESSHADDSNVPLIITEGSADFGAAGSHWWGTVQADGNDIVASSRTGTAYPTRVIAINTTARTMIVAVKLPAIDADADTDLLLQCGGTGPDSTAVFAGCYAGNADYEIVWPFQETAGAVASDFGPNGYNGAIVGAAVNQAGIFGRSYDFEATDAADLVSNAAAGNFEYTQALSVLGWVKRESGGFHVILSRWNVADSRGWAWSFNGATHVQSFSRCNGAAPRMIAGGTVQILLASGWTHLAMISNASSLVSGVSGYVNGANDAVSSVDNDLAGNTVLVADPFYVGARANNDGWFDGLLEFIRVVKAELSRPQIGTHYSDEVDASNNGAWLIGEQDVIPPVSPQAQTAIVIGIANSIGF